MGKASLFFCQAPGNPVLGDTTPDTGNRLESSDAYRDSSGGMSEEFPLIPLPSCTTRWIIDSKKHNIFFSVKPYIFQVS